MARVATNSMEDLLAFAGQLGLDKPAEEILGQAIETVLRATGSIYGCLATLEENSGRLIVQFCQGDAPSVKDGDFTNNVRFLIDQVITSGQPLVVERVPETAQGKALEGPVMVVPMRAAGRIVGVLYLYAGLGATPYDQNDLDLATAVANQTGLFLVYAQLKRSKTGGGRSTRDYISLVTHQLRVPLTSISGYTDLILSGRVGALTDRQEEFLQRVKRNAGRMSDLIDNLAEINRIETGAKTYELVEFDVVRVVELVVGDALTMLELREQKVQIDIIEEPVNAFADQTIVSRILADLLSNASRYSPVGGHITVHVGRRDGFGQVSVTDEGIGISEADQAKLYDPFFRSEDPAVREFNGWGLSLPLAKLLIEAQGGQIDCQSQPGHGSTFLLSFPLAE